MQGLVVFLDLSVLSPQGMYVPAPKDAAVISFTVATPPSDRQETKGTTLSDPEKSVIQSCPSSMSFLAD